MKNRLFLLIMVIIGNLLNGQSYILDATYGTQGYKFNDNYLLNPKGLLKLNQSYFYFSTNEISKTNYNGSLDSSFGVNSKLSFDNSNETYTINGGKIINNSIYLFGKIVNTNVNSEDGFVLKISENGIYDTSFGLNGISKINLGEDENIFDFSIDDSGKLFCTAKKTNSSSSRIVTFKLLSNGSIDTSFGTNSFKEHIFNSLAQSGADVNKIIKVSDGYLLIGKTIHTEVLNNYTYFNSNIAIAKVDENGNYVTSFGTNGIKLIHLTTSLDLYSIKDAQLVNSNLYINISQASSFSSQGRYLKKIDINNFQTIFNVPIYYDSNFKLDVNENIYVVGINRCNSGPCIRSFMLKKFNSSGNVDTSFAQNGIYTYSFPGLSVKDYQSSVVNLEEDGKIVVGGYVFRNYYNANNVVIGPFYGLSSIRIEQGVLNNESFDLDENITIFPNPVTDNLNVICKEEIKEIKIFDLQNKLILKTNKFDNNSLDVRKLDAGLYIVVISTDSNTYFKKCIKK
ncbi:T9SS type A sorting domain-containing protein [Flavobacterium sp.]|uniref:T9SS type A sorting domain-containing protein n=1 Tax=Flavobacterium sp. TaxID=239 RepID=UPI0037BE9057